MEVSLVLKLVKGYLKSGPGRMLRPGEPAPDFELKSHAGRTVRLSDHRGERVLLWFYPKAGTPG